MIKKTKDILDIIGEPYCVENTLKRSKNNEGVLLATPHYLAIGCDLTLLDELSELLRTLFDEPDSLFAFTAEVSITYMPREAADNLIAWASQFTQSRFVLLEQIIPSGPDHPFAKTMLRHFNKLNTPLNSVMTYQTVSDQKTRYESLGWNHVQASDLFQFWERSISNEEKRFLDSVEAFDEWEEFILFGQHYVILYASTSDTPSTLLDADVTEFPKLPESLLPFEISKTSSPHSSRKFSAGCVYNDTTLIQNGGFTTKRTNNSVLFSSNETQQFAIEKEPLKERMCHAIAKIGYYDFILTGGRQAPSSPLTDCWRLKNNAWSKIQDLPEPRSRHFSFASSDGELYVVGGSFDCSSTWLKLDNINGWLPVRVVGANVPNLMSSAVAFNEMTGRGILFGGMNKDYDINSHIFSFSLEENQLSCTDITSRLSPKAVLSLSRYGAKATFLGDDLVLIAGGVSPASLIPNNETFILFDTANFTAESIVPNLNSEFSMPLLSGFSLNRIGTNIVLYGGGAICFSFGAYWNDATVLSLEGTGTNAAKFLTLSKLPVILETPKPPSLPRFKPRVSKKPKIKKVLRMPIADVANYEDFLSKVYSNNTPVVFEKANIGPSTLKWTDPEYLIKTVGGDRKIVAHVSDGQNLNFLAKNFKYETMEFQDFIRSVFKTEKTESDKNLYLRSLSTESPTGKPAIFRHDFESLSADFSLPDSLKTIEDTHFSSPLRISSPNTAIWLHYDVTANILCQVVGRKRVRLYPPSDVHNLSFPAGASTSLIENIFEFPESSLPGRCRPIEVVLEPGDIVFIPATWLHATLPLEASISLNFFWKDLSPEIYGPGRDIYGNKDIAAYENGRRAVQKIKQSFEGVPDEIKRFYLLRLAAELKENI